MLRCRALSLLALLALLALPIAPVLISLSPGPALAGQYGDVDPEITKGPLTAEEEALVQRFTLMWNLRQEGVFQNRFLGIQTLQHPFDVWVTQEILYEVKPDFVIETGTYRGGSAILWAMYLQQIKPGARVITIDITDQRSYKAKQHRLAGRRVDFLLGSSTAPEIVADVERRVKGRRAVVILDSLHTADHVYAELNAYGPLVPVGSYIIVQDTGAGPYKGIERFLAEHDDFVVDETRERLLLTSNHGGYLKRIDPAAASGKGGTGGAVGQPSAGP